MSQGVGNELRHALIIREVVFPYFCFGGGGSKDTIREVVCVFLSGESSNFHFLLVKPASFLATRIPNRNQLFKFYLQGGL